MNALRYLFIILGLFISISIVSLPQKTWGVDLAKEFSADIAIAPATEGAKQNLGKVFVKNEDSFRAEFKLNEQDQILIYRNDKLYLLNPDKKTYREYNEMRFDQGFRALRNTDLKWEKIGDKEVNGVKAVKWNVTVPLDKETKTIKVWTDAANNYPLRVKVDNYIANIANFRPETQDATLFEIPENYTKTQE